MSSHSLEPLMPEVGVLALVPDHWHVSWQLRHHVLTRLSRYFHVVWMDPSREWRDFFKPPKIPAAQDHEDFESPGFVVRPATIWLPKLYRPVWLARWTQRTRLLRARRLLLNRGCRKIILYLWRPEFYSALEAVPHDLSCYHIDDEYSFAEVELPGDALETELMLHVDQVFIHSKGLLEKKGSINRNTAFIPNGVDFDAYSRPAVEPHDMAGIPRPRLGYTGRIKKQLDWPLILELTRRFPHYSFVFVGPVVPHPDYDDYLEEFSRRPNVHMLGAKPTAKLAVYPQHFDVCLMPYQRNDYTKYIYPLKLHEYLAGGAPVVGTNIRSLQEFAEVVALPDSLDEWCDAIERALWPEANTLRRRAERQAAARPYDWQRLVQAIAVILADGLKAGFPPAISNVEELARK